MSKLNKINYTISKLISIYNIQIKLYNIQIIFFFNYTISKLNKTIIT